MNFSKLTLGTIWCLIWITIQAQDGAEISDQVFDLDELEVVGKNLEKPDLVFKTESPRISYYTPPELPNGEVIVALDFIDRYASAPVPGPRKWAAIITFPWVDGYEKQYVQWLCLYLWDGRIYGFCPDAAYDSQMRFVLPISADRSSDPEELYSMASNYVEAISPPDVQVVYYEDFSGSNEGYTPTTSGFENPLNNSSDPLSGMQYSDPLADMGSTTGIEYIDIPAGRIEGWRPSDKGKNPEELVSMVYQYSKDPNPDVAQSGAMGPDEIYKEANRFWNKYFKFDFSPSPDPFDTARELLKPRWSIRATLLYEKNVLFFKDVDHKAEVLLFNVGQPIFAYHPRYGVWRTEATIAMIAEGRGSDLITYPGVEKPMRVLLRRWPD